MAQLRSELLLKEGTFVQQKQDYEDLLVLLEDQDGKIKKLKVCEKTNITLMLNFPLKGSFGQKSDFSKIGHVKVDGLGETLLFTGTKSDKSWPRYGASNTTRSKQDFCPTSADLKSPYRLRHRTINQSNLSNSNVRRESLLR